MGKMQHGRCKIRNEWMRGVNLDESSSKIIRLVSIDSDVATFDAQDFGNQTTKHPI